MSADEQLTNLTNSSTAEPTATPAPVPAPTATTPATTGGKVYSEDEVERLIKDRVEREKKAREKAAEEARAKAAEEAAQQNQEFEKLAKLNADKAAQLEAELKALKLAETKRRIAAKIGLPEALAARLLGESEDEIEKDAKALLETLPKPPAPPEPKKPQPGPIPAANPGANGQQGETLAQKLARIHGSPNVAFDADHARRHGGGVVYNVGKEE